MGDRFVYSFNEYPFWALNCYAYPEPGKWTGISQVMSDYKNRIAIANKNKHPVIWMTETGWSSTVPSSQYPPVCPNGTYGTDYCSVARLKGYYQGFREWDLGYAEFGFYFSLRDSSNFGMTEGFGLVNGCAESTSLCKISDGPGPAPTPTPAPTSPGPAPAKSTCADIGCSNHDTTCWCTDTCKEHDSCCPDYDDKCAGAPTPRPTPNPSPATKSTCADLQCGNHDDTCWCTDTCKNHDSCCPDYDEQCGKHIDIETFV